MCANPIINYICLIEIQQTCEFELLEPENQPQAQKNHQKQQLSQDQELKKGKIAYGPSKIQGQNNPSIPEQNKQVEIKKANKELLQEQPDTLIIAENKEIQVKKEDEAKDLTTQDTNSKQEASFKAFEELQNQFDNANIEASKQFGQIPSGKESEEEQFEPIQPKGRVLLQNQQQMAANVEISKDSLPKTLQHSKAVKRSYKRSRIIMLVLFLLSAAGVFLLEYGYLPKQISEMIQVNGAG